MFATLFKHVNDFKLEYMDLDEFLNENELPADTEQEDQPQRQQQPDYEPLPIPKDCNTSKTLMNQVVSIITKCRNIFAITYVNIQFLFRVLYYQIEGFYFEGHQKWTNIFHRCCYKRATSL